MVSVCIVCHVLSGGWGVRILNAGTYNDFGIVDGCFLAIFLGRISIIFRWDLEGGEEFGKKWGRILELR